VLRELRTGKGRRAMISGEHSLRNLWIAIGAFLLVFSCVPLGSDYRGLVFFWDLFTAFAGNTGFGLLAVYFLVAGIALIVFANLFRDFGQGAAALTLGVVGVVLSAVAVAGGVSGVPGAGEIDVGVHGKAVVPALIAMATLLFALVGNNARIHHPDSRLGKMLGGIGACVAGALLLVALVTGAIHLIGMIGDDYGDSSLSDMLSTYPVPQLASVLPLLLACLFMGLNLADSPKARRRARAAQKLALAGLGLLGTWMVFGPTIAAVVEGEIVKALWGCLTRTRAVGLAWSLMFLVGGGAAGVVRSLLYEVAAGRGSALAEDPDDIFDLV
jgi:hypothetical protein